MNVFELFAKLSLDDKEYNEGLDSAKKSASNIGKAIGTGLKVGGAAIAAVGSATTAMTGAFIKGASEVATYGDNIDKMSQKLGLSYEAFQEWDYVLSQSGADINSMSTGLKTLTNKIDDAKNGGADAQAMFSKLGISLDELNSMSREDIFEAAIYGFQSMADSTERAALANDLFGRSGQELTPLFNATIEETKELQQAAHDLGFVMSDEGVKASADYNDAMDTMQRTLNGVKRGMLSDFLPAVTKVMDGLTKIFSGQGGVEEISEGLEEFANKILETAPTLLNVGGGIVTALLTSIGNNLPQLASAAIDAMLMLATYLIENLPMLIDAAFTIITTLADGLVKSLPELIPAIIDVVLKIVDTLTDPDNIGLLIDAALAIMIALAEGLIEAVPRLIEKAPEIIINLVTAIIENLPKIIMAAGKIIWALIKGIGESLYKLGEAAWEIIKELGTAIAEKAQDLWNKAKEIIDIIGEGIAHWAVDLIEKGKEIVNGVWEGIKSKATEFYNNVVGFFKNIVDGVKNALGIASPSKVFASIGDMMAAGLEKGFDDGMTDAERTMSRDMEHMVDALSGNTVQFGNIDFASSGLGKSSAALMNGLAANGQLGGNLSVQVVLPDGTEVARAWLPDFLRVASSNGTPLTA